MVLFECVACVGILSAGFLVTIVCLILFDRTLDLKYLVLGVIIMAITAAGNTIALRMF
jgi:hypothetical protein